MSINRVEMSGNLTKDCEVRDLPSGDGKIISFRMAVNGRAKNKDTGEWEDHANFISCTMFSMNGARDWMIPALVKGAKVYVAGEFRYQEWTDKETGQPRSTIDVLVRDIDSNWPPKEQGVHHYRKVEVQKGYQPISEESVPVEAYGAMQDYSDDIPF